MTRDHMIAQNLLRFGPSFICQPSPSRWLTPLTKAAAWSILSCDNSDPTF
eukprot:COSAG02_NODE_3086_length_7385_cov_371.477111_4_plen_50_part_00